jgi:hypothetical protein
MRYPACNASATIMLASTESKIVHPREVERTNDAAAENMVATIIENTLNRAKNAPNTNAASPDANIEVPSEIVRY